MPPDGAEADIPTTAAAIFALDQYWSASADTPPDLDRACTRRVREGLGYLVLTQNPDGGWPAGPPPGPSDLVATQLCRVAFTAKAAGAAGGYENTVRAADAWMDRKPDDKPLAETPASVLMLCAVAGRGGPPREAWSRVSKALRRGPDVTPPERIAVGLARDRRLPTWSPVARLLRAAGRGRALRALELHQAADGGFGGRAFPTAVVVAALTAAGESSRPAVGRAVGYLLRTARPDGSWGGPVGLDP